MNGGEEEEERDESVQTKKMGKRGNLLSRGEVKEQHVGRRTRTTNKKLNFQQRTE